MSWFGRLSEAREVMPERYPGSATSLIGGSHGRLIVIGDIHGCVAELDALIATLQVRKRDTLVAVGDLINRGPDSCGVIDRVRELGIQTVVGNHELRLLKAYRTGRVKDLKSADRETFAQLRPSDWDWLEDLPLTLEFPEWNVLVVHGGFMPYPQWRRQTEDVVTQIQVITPLGKPAKRRAAPDGRAWADYWTGPEVVIYGHTPRPEPLLHRHAIGIDTGCVYGGKLTACILPGRLMVQIPAKKAYYKGKHRPDYTI